MRQMIAGNWKMNGTRDGITRFAAGMKQGVEGVDLLVCPPFTLIGAMIEAFAGTGIAVGGQDCADRRSGPHTGDIAADMLVDSGARYVILGHSERRADHGESSALVRDKAQAAAAAGLTPIICVGETEGERDAGEADTVVRAQLAGSVPEGFAGMIAYEPVWAIGSGKTPGEADVAAMHATIRAALKRQLGEAGVVMRVLYGGSVKPANAAAMLRIENVGGALIGGASLKAEDFLAVARAAAV